MCSQPLRAPRVTVWHASRSSASGCRAPDAAPQSSREPAAAFSERGPVSSSSSRRGAMGPPRPRRSSRRSEREPEPIPPAPRLPAAPAVPPPAVPPPAPPVVADVPAPRLPAAAAFAPVPDAPVPPAPPPKEPVPERPPSPVPVAEAPLLPRSPPLPLMGRPAAAVLEPAPELNRLRAAAPPPPAISPAERPEPRPAPPPEIPPGKGPRSSRGRRHVRGGCRYPRSSRPASAGCSAGEPVRGRCQGHAGCRDGNQVFRRRRGLDGVRRVVSAGNKGGGIVRRPVGLAGRGPPPEGISPGWWELCRSRSVRLRSSGSWPAGGGGFMPWSVR